MAKNPPWPYPHPGETGCCSPGEGPWSTLCHPNPAFRRIWPSSHASWQRAQAWSPPVTLSYFFSLPPVRRSCWSRTAQRPLWRSQAPARLPQPNRHREAREGARQPSSTAGVCSPLASDSPPCHKLLQASAGDLLHRTHGSMLQHLPDSTSAIFTFIDKLSKLLKKASVSSLLSFNGPLFVPGAGAGFQDPDRKAVFLPQLFNKITVILQRLD